MDDQRVHRVGHIACCAAALIFALSFMVLVCWLVLATPKTKLFEADNVVCASQPAAITCWHR